MKKVIAFVLCVLLSLFCCTACDGSNSNDTLNTIEKKLNSRLEITVKDKMALSYINSRFGDSKYEYQERYFIYIKIEVKNISGATIEFGTADSDYYAKLDIGRAVDQPVYFQEATEANQRIPYWTSPDNGGANWDKILWFYASSDLVSIQAGKTKEFYLAFLNSTTNKNYNLNLNIYENTSVFFSDDVAKTINLGILEIVE